MSNNTPIYSEELIGLNKVNINDKAKNFSKNNFWYYTSVSTLDKILKNQEIWVSSFARMNDIKEAQLHNNKKSDVYALCFCNTSSEKIPMWYLYAGITGKGMRMGLTPSKMLGFIKHIDKVYPINDGVKSKDPLIIGRDISLEYGWIYYRKSLKTLKFKNKWYDLNDSDNFEKNNYFIKDYPWEYEKEFRLLFKNNTGKHIDRIAVKISDDILKSLKLTFAPEIDNGEDILLLEGFQNYLKSKIDNSSLSIKMDLLSRNKSDIIANIDDFIDNETAKEICKKISEKQLCNSKEE